MSDASGTCYASPTGSDLQNGGAGQQQGNDEGYGNVSFQLEPGEQNPGQESMRRASIGTMATHIGGAGTPTTTQQESQAPTTDPTDPLLQSLLISVRLLTQKVNLIVGRQSELQQELEANLDNDEGFHELEQLQERLRGVMEKKDEAEAKLENHQKQAQARQVPREQVPRHDSFTHQVAHHQHPPGGSFGTRNGPFVPTAGLSAGSGSGAGPPAGLPRWGPAAGTGTGFAAPTGRSE